MHAKKLRYTDYHKSVMIKSLVMLNAEAASAHQLLELEWVHLRVRALLASQHQETIGQETLRGLYISDEEVQGLLAAPIGQGLLADSEMQASLSAQEADLEQQIAALRLHYQGQDIRLPLDILAAQFGLSLLDIRLFVMAAAPSIDHRFERLYGYLQDDITQAYLTPDLGLRLLGYGPAQMVTVLTRLRPEAPLRRYRLLSMQTNPHGAASALNSRMYVDERCLSYVLGQDLLDTRLAAFVRPVKPVVAFSDLILPDDLRQRLETVTAQAESRFMFYFQGPAGYGKRTTAEAFCRARGQTILVVDGGSLTGQAAESINDLLALLCRECRLTQAVVYWERADLLWRQAPTAFAAALRACLDATDMVFLAGEERWPADRIEDDTAFFPVVFELPSYSERAQLWHRLLPDNRGMITATHLAEIASQFRLSAGQIVSAVRAAHDQAYWRDPALPALAPADVYAACRHQLHVEMDDLGRKINPRHTWNDLVLPPEPLAHLRELCDAVRFRGKVLDEWGFDSKLSLGRGISALFAGPSGTGKTMAAEVIAAELGMELIKVDLSAVISKYIGETEKNLKRVFDAAEHSQVLLLLDEADALFGKRTEVRDSHDRYANIEVNYLLQRIEEFDGVAILSTNLRKNMDEAFMRRLMYIVDFPFPTVEDRLRIWQGIWPPQVPLSSDIDFVTLAEQLEIAGGHIRNIALAAAFQAAAEGGMLTMAHLLQAARNELMKMGKIITD